MAKRKQRARRDTAFINLIMELAPGDKFIECSFTQCQFTGLGGAEFENCMFIDCDCTHLGKTAVTFSSCQFGYMPGDDLVDE